MNQVWAVVVMAMSLSSGALRAGAHGLNVAASNQSIKLH